MALVLVLALAAVSLGLAAWLFFHHEDRAGAAAAVVVSLLGLALWSTGDAGRESLETDLETARERIEVLETKPATRGFSAEVRAGMVRDLGKFVGPTAYVLSNAPDHETTEYARALASILKDAGWNVPASFGMTYAPMVLPGQDGPASGVIFGVSPEVPESFADSVFMVFHDAGVDIRRGPHWPGTEHPISILVGPKGAD